MEVLKARGECIGDVRVYVLRLYRDEMSCEFCVCARSRRLKGGIADNIGLIGRYRTVIKRGVYWGGKRVGF